MKVIAINGSPRAGGNTEQLIKVVFAELEKAGIETELIRIGGQSIRGCTACFRCGELKRCVIDNDPVNGIIEKLKTADGIILGSPVYFTDVTAEMKAFIDRSGLVMRTIGFPLCRKASAGLVAVRRGGEMHALDTLTHYLHYMQTYQVGSTYWNFAFGRGPGEVMQDEEGMATMKTLGQNMAHLMKQLAK
jgi:multimeric flavodoxin WrbA